MSVMHDRSFGRARFAVTAIFFMNGATFANWVPRIPQITHELGLSEGELGLALLGLAAGAVTAMPLAGWATAHIGSRPATCIAGAAFGLALMLIGLADGQPVAILQASRQDWRSCKAATAFLGTNLAFCTLLRSCRSGNKEVINARERAGCRQIARLRRKAG